MYLGSCEMKVCYNSLLICGVGKPPCSHWVKIHPQPCVRWYALNLIMHYIIFTHYSLFSQGHSNLLDR